jgi:hypothetical protein
MNLTDSRLAQGGCEKLELAMLSFFEQFRKIYVGDQVGPSKLFPRSFSSLINFMWNFILSNQCVCVDEFGISTVQS